jgi:ribosomal protein S18 acetylase RimI-like enzyme
LAKTASIIEYTDSPSFDDIQLLTDGINEVSSKLGIKNAQSFAFFARNNNSEIIAGANGSVVYGEIHTDQLWVHPNFQNQGLGKSLMNVIHSLGIHEKCSFATVCTMTFQHAEGFYEKLGYVQDFERHGYTKNASCIFLKKNL